MDEETLSRKVFPVLELEQKLAFLLKRRGLRASNGQTEDIPGGITNAR